MFATYMAKLQRHAVALDPQMMTLVDIDIGSRPVQSTSVDQNS